MPTPKYLLTLGKTYYEKGFFNLGVEVSRFVSPKNCPATLLAGASKTRFEVRIDRDANPATSAPRIFGGNALRNWIQGNCRLGEIVEIHVHSPTELQLLRTDGLASARVVEIEPWQSAPPSGQAPATQALKGESAMHELRAFGFVDAGCFRLTQSGLALDLGSIGEARRALYAFVADDTLLYIGKTVNQLKQRLYFYCRPGPTQSTNIRANALIRDLLSNGSTVKVLAFADPGSVKHGRFPVNLAAGLEDTLIAEFRPPWNKAGT